MRLSRQEKREARYLRLRETRRAKASLHRWRPILRSSEDPAAGAAVSASLRGERDQAESRVRDAVAGAGLRVCIELGFEQSDRERRSLCRQISGAYGRSRRAVRPLHLHLASLGETWCRLLNAQGLDAWHITRLHRSAVESFETDSLIVLSPDAPEALESFDKDKVYVIGGIVDRSVRKAVSLEWATAHGVCTKRLPVREHLQGKPKFVLNIDAVVEVICRFQETSDWRVALESAIPQRYSKSNDIAHEQFSDAALPDEEPCRVVAQHHIDAQGR